MKNKKLSAKNNISKNTKDQVLPKKCNNSEGLSDKILPFHKNNVSEDPRDNLLSPVKSNILLDLKGNENPVEPSDSNQSNTKDQINDKKNSVNENNNPAEIRKIITNRIKAKLLQKKEDQNQKLHTNQNDVKNCHQQDDSKKGHVNHLPKPNKGEDSQVEIRERVGQKIMYLLK